MFEHRLPLKRLLPCSLTALIAAAAFTASSAFAALAVPEAAAVPTATAPNSTISATAADPLLGLLLERGLLKPLENSVLVRSMRDTATELVISAMNFLGVPYRRGGSNNDTGFDCSGFTRHIFEISLGLLLPRRAEEQATSAGLFSIARDQLRPGDLVFFNTLRQTFSHVGIYVGDDKFIHAPRSGALVRIDDMTQSYWSQRFTGARRADAVSASTPVPAAR